ncbi:hypothetical protein LQK83_11115 [Rhizobium sp. C1]|nr:hypothetical protein [Rhizobium sp. C1]
MKIIDRITIILVFRHVFDGRNPADAVRRRLEIARICSPLIPGPNVAARATRKPLRTKASKALLFVALARAQDDSR